MKLLLQAKNFEPDIPQTESVRYLGYRGIEPDESLLADISACKKQVREAATPRFVCAEFALQRTEAALILEGSGIALEGKSIAEHLAQSRRCLVLAATLGSGIEKLSHYMQVSAPHMALIIDACANAMIEDYCDKIAAAAEAEACGPHETLTWRFSPGYGDLPLEIHTRLLPVLNTGRVLGLYETKTHLLTPQKSVTALMGVIHKGVEKGKHGCEACPNYTICNFRQGGTSCGA